MKAPKTLFTILILLHCAIVFSQVGNSKRAWHWYFGWNAGLDFSNGTELCKKTLMGKFI
jgi:hypothetical protein